MADLSSIITKAINTHETKQSTPTQKRKAYNQLSTEKNKPNKLSNLEPFPPLNMSSSNEPTGTRPKPLRVPANQISGADCVAAFATRNSILKKDAIHTPPIPEPPTIDSTTHQLGDLLLDKSHLIIQALDAHLKELLITSLKNKDDQNQTLLQDTNPEFNKFCDAVYSILAKIMHDFKLLTSLGEFAENASQALCSAFATNANIVIKNQSEKILPFILSPERTSAPKTHQLIILGANFDQMWTTLIKSSISNSSCKTSLSTLSSQAKKIGKTVTAQHIIQLELDHQVDKIAVRLGDLRTAEIETKYRDLEQEIRVHGINTLGIGTDKHFRTLTYPNKVKAVHDFIKSHLDEEVPGFSAQIHSPKTGARHFETLVVVRFTHATAKYQFEKNFSEYRKANPTCTISTSRPNPPRAPSDRDMPDIKDVRGKLGMMYNHRIAQTKLTQPDINFTELKSEEIENLQVTVKTKNRPFTLYYEFLDPSNGTTFCHYDL